MGCDIHSYVETKNKDGIWHLVQTFSHPDWNPEFTEPTEPFNGRNYSFFGWLTGGVVRISDPKGGLGAPKGIPMDVSSGIYQLWERDENWSHSASYATLAELREAIHETPKKIVDFWTGEKVMYEARNCAKTFANGVDFLGHSCGFYGDDCDIRVVFWFDS